MSLTSNIVRAINTPTVMEEYEQDQEGYNQMVDPETATQLSREYDRVTGNEALYRTLLSRIIVDDHSAITGNEGFFDTIKKGVSTIIQTVKDFFKWLWEFFTGKTVVWGHKVESLEEKLKKTGVPSGEIKYPAGWTGIYNQKTAPSSSLTWLGEALTDLKSGLGKVDAYVKALKKFGDSVGGLLGNDKASALDKEIEDLHTQIKNIFKATGSEPVKFFCNYTVKVTGGSAEVKPLTLSFDGKKEFKFKTDSNQIAGYMNTAKGISDEFIKHIKDSSSLEQGFIKALNKTLEAAKAEDPNKTAPGKIQTVVRTAMGDIKRMETALQRAVNSALDVLGAAIFATGGKSNAS